MLGKNSAHPTWVRAASSSWACAARAASAAAACSAAYSAWAGKEGQEAEGPLICAHEAQSSHSDGRSL